MSEQDIIRREEFLDKQDPLRHLRALDADGELVPVQTPSILAQRTDLLIPGVNHGDTGITVKLALNAAPGCGGIAWPAGEASNRFTSSRAVPEILSASCVQSPGAQFISPPTRSFFPQIQNRPRTGQWNRSRRSRSRLYRCRTRLDNRSEVSPQPSFLFSYLFQSPSFPGASRARIPLRVQKWLFGLLRM